MTPDNLIAQVKLRTARDTDVDDTAILSALNTVQRENNLAINFQELTVHDSTSLILAALTQTYDLPTDFLKMLIIWDNHEYQTELTRITPQEYKIYLPNRLDTETATDPRYYSLLNSVSNVKQIQLFPLKASLLTGTIASVADYSGTVAGTVVATDVAHGLSTSDTITVVTTGGTDYSGTYSITRIDADTFYFTATWVATGTGTWTRLDYVPFAYIQKVPDLTAGGSANVLTTYYPDLYIEGAAYYVYRDLIYRDQPEKIAFREQQYKKQIEIIKIAQKQPDLINKVASIRMLPSTKQLYSTQYSGYTS